MMIIRYGDTVMTSTAVMIKERVKKYLLSIIIIVIIMSELENGKIKSLKN